ncbi:MAG: exodeoxyribonuclease small subunit [Candidatus Krumholzibacteriota bacterium]|nr:exodeoxyribonuclease small subunit [Candidatus Krumholzibacteriota bacterium]
MKRLEEIVRELEGKDLSLEDSIAKFEEGVKLGKICRELLEKAETRIKVLVEDEKGALQEREERDDTDR